MFGLKDRVRGVYRTCLGILVSIVGIGKTKQIDSLLRFGRRLDLSNPCTLADKVSWLELNTDQKTPARLTDKYEVRKFVLERGLGEILVPLCGGPWTDATQVKLAELPESFALKATHGCGMNLICKDRSVIDEEQLSKTVEGWLKKDYARASTEPHYQMIPRRVYCEQYIGSTGEVIDYKFHCINGRPEFILVCSNRQRSLRLNLYDLDWRAIDGLKGRHVNDSEVPRPETLERMRDVATALSEGFAFVRVDLYSDAEHVRFGELTFSPAAGVFPNFSERFIREQGMKLELPSPSERRAKGRHEED